MNATADVGAQLSATPELWPRPGGRATLVRDVLLTDAQLDHTLGLFELRQAAGLRVLGPAAIVEAVRDGLGAGAALGAYVPVEWVVLPVGVAVALDTGLTVRAMGTGGRPPRYVPATTESGPAAAPEAAGAAVGGPWSVAYELADGAGNRVVYAPVVAAPSPALESACGSAGAVLFDGTFWSDDEPETTGFSDRPARAFGHLPIAGPDGSLAWLAALAANNKAYTHLNNTNPLVDPDSAERRQLEACGVRVAEDEEVIEL